METGSYCAYNVTLDVLLSEHVREVSGQLEPLQFLTTLLNGPGINRQSALWLRHFSGAREWPRLFAFDVAYLDADQRIVGAASVGPGTDFPPPQADVASVLLLSDGQLSATGSTRGNVIRICAKAEPAAEIGPASYSSSGPHEAHMQAQILQNQPEVSPSFDATRLPEFVFEPFIGSLVYLPDPALPRAQSTEYFLTREVWDAPISAQIQETRQAQEVEEVITEPISPELSEAQELNSNNEEAQVLPDTQFPPALEEAIQLIREQARRETEILKESRKKKAKTSGEKKTPPKRRPRQVERRAITAEQTTTPFELSAAVEPAQNPQLSMQTAPEVLELRIVPEPFAEVPSAIKKTEQPDIQAENAQIAPEEAIAPSIEQIEEVPVASVLESATEALMPQPPAVEEPLREITTPETKRKRTEKEDKLSIGRRLQHWLMGTMAAPRRRSARIAVPGLVAFYWSGGAPMPHEIVNISKSGFYLRTRDLWLPDTLVRMTLERPRGNRGEKKQSIGVLARVVRIDEDGVGHEFVTTEDLRRIRTQHILPKQGTSKKDLEAFLGMH